MDLRNEGHANHDIAVGSSPHGHAIGKRILRILLDRGDPELVGIGIAGLGRVRGMKTECSGGISRSARLAGAFDEKHRGALRNESTRIGRLGQFLVNV